MLGPFDIDVVASACPLSLSLSLFQTLCEYVCALYAVCVCVFAQHN